MTWLVLKRVAQCWCVSSNQEHDQQESSEDEQEEDSAPGEESGEGNVSSWLPRISFSIFHESLPSAEFQEESVSFPSTRSML